MNGGHQRVSMMMVTLFLGAMIVWTPPAFAAQSDDSELQAQAIDVTFDPVGEQTIVTWYNVQTSDGFLWTEMQSTYYWVYRHDAPINWTVVQNEGLMPFANVTACLFGDSSCVSPGSHAQHTVIFPLPAGTNGTFYYAIATWHALNNSVTANFNHGESNVSEGIFELTQPETAPFYVTANYDPLLSATDIAWVNLNSIVPNTLDESGPNAYMTKIFRHEDAATRANWQGIPKELIAILGPGNSTYRHYIPPETDVDAYYSITYQVGMYEDVRFLGTNTLAFAVHEDNVWPEHVEEIETEFAAESLGGTGNTTITWVDLESESGETYYIWRSSTPINNTSTPGVELIATMPKEFGFYRHEVPRGILGYSYYAITVADTNGNRNTTVPASVTDSLAENTFDPWIAEPTAVFAEHLGYGQTRITWMDQLGAEGEEYHVWRADIRLTSLSNLSLEATLVATIPDGLGTIVVDVPEFVNRLSFYCVTSLARYGHLSAPYEDTRFQQNCYGPISEDTLPPSLPFMQDASMQQQGSQKIALLRWVNDITENDETYQLWINHQDPFEGNTTRTSGDILTDPGWEMILDPIDAPFNNVPDFTRTVDLEPMLNQTTWYAVTITDKWGNTNTQYSISLNARQVLEDTTPPTFTMEMWDDDDNVIEALTSGEYRLRFTVSEPLAEFPIINITTMDYQMDEFGIVNSGTAFTTQGSTVRAIPVAGEPQVYYFDFEVLSTTATTELIVKVMLNDVSWNTASYQSTGWPIDAALPTIDVYSPSADSLYLYGEMIHVYGAVGDDVGVESVQLMFTYWESGLKRETEWTEVVDLTPDSEDPSTLVFEWWEPAATFVDKGNQRIDIRAYDASGNEALWNTVFIVDRCERTIDYVTICEDDLAIPTPPELEPVEETYYEGVYGMVYLLGGVNLVLLIIVMLALMLGSGGGSKKGEGEEEEDDWMMEFMGGTGGDPSSDSSLDNAPEQDLSKAKTLDDDAEEESDPFASAEGKERKRRSSKKKKAKVTEPDEDDDDEFGDDDWGDEEEEAPRKKKRRKASRRSVKRKK